MKHMERALAVLFAALVVVGCGRSAKFDAPKLYPIEITVANAGTPIEGATVSLIPDESGNKSFSIGATTDAAGLAKIRTTRASFMKDGAPAGSYKVVVVKPVEIKYDKTPDEIDEMAPDEKVKYQREIDAKIRAAEAESGVARAFTTADSTPLTVEVKAEKNIPVAFDLSEF